MLTLIILLFFISIFTIFISILKIAYKNKISILYRLDKVKGRKDSKDNMDELSAPFYQRVIMPIGRNISEAISKTTPKGTKNRIEVKLALAGNPYNLGVNQWFLVKRMLGIVLPLIILVYGLLTKILFSKAGIMLLFIIIILNVFPNLYLTQASKKRIDEITKTLPDVLDILTVSVEAGLSFDGAISRLVEKMPGELSHEFGKVLGSMRMGKTRSEALRDMSERCGVSDLTTLVGSIIQADQLGVGIGKVLRIQSEQMRQKRRQRAQEKAMKAPIKILFPLIFFIFPSIFAVLLGPAVIKFMEAFGG